MKKKFWKYILPIAIMPSIIASTILSQTIASNQIIKNHSNDNVNNNLANNEFENETNNKLKEEPEVVENINDDIDKIEFDSSFYDGNVSTRASEPPFKNNAINWSDYEWKSNGLYAKDIQKTILSMFPRIKGPYSRINILDFMYINNNLSSAYDQRTLDMFNFFNKTSWRKDDFYFQNGFQPSGYNSKLQGVKYSITKSSNTSDSGISNYSCIAYLAFDFWSSSSSSIYRRQTSISFYLADIFWNLSNVQEKLSKRIQTEIQKRGNELPRSAWDINNWIISEINTFDKYNLEIVNVKPFTTNFFNTYHYLTIDNPYRIIYKNTFPTWFTSNNGQLEISGLTARSANGSNVNNPFPGDLVFSVAKTAARARVNINDYCYSWTKIYTQEILRLWRSNRENQIFNEFVERFNNSFDHYKEVLVFNAPYGSTKIFINDIRQGSRNDELIVDFTMTQAFGNPDPSNPWKGRINNLRLTTTLYGFNSPTRISRSQIWYSDTIYKSIFGSSDRGFAIDFNNDRYNKQNQLKNYINSHISDFFNPILQGTNVSVSNVSISVYSNYANASITYSGVNSNNQFSSNITGNIEIRLKPNPTPSTFADFQQFLQNKINNENQGLMPTESKIKEWASNYLNQSYIKEKIPNAVGTINSNNIVLDSSKIHKSTSPITFDEGAIKTNTNPVLTFPSLSVTVKNTIIVSSIAANYPISSYKALEILGIWNSNHNDATIQTLKSWIESNKTSIFKNTHPSNATIVSIDNITRGNNDSSLNVTITLSSCYTINEGIVYNKKFTFTITNFCSGSITATTQKLTTINYNDSIFKTIFGENNKGFIFDFEKDLVQNTTKLETYIKSNMGAFFNIDGLQTVKLTTKITLTKTADNVMTATFNYQGFKNSNEYVYDNHGKIIINLRSNPTPSDLSGFNQFLQDKIDNKNNGLWPNDELLTQWVSEFLNKIDIKTNLPDSCIPGGRDGSFSASDISIDASKINRKTLPVIFAEGGIKTKTDPVLTFPTLSINITNTVTVESIAASDPINIYTAAEIYGIWKTEPSNKIINTLKTWIETNKATIFKNTQPSNATVLSIDDIVQGSQNNSLDVTITLSQAYTIDKGLSYNQKFTFTIIDFKAGEILPTTQKLASITYTDEIFKTIFGSNNKGFIIDFKNNLIQNTTSLEEFIKANADVVFNTNGLKTVGLTSRVSLSQTADDVITATFEYSGFNDNKEFINNNQGTIAINLKANLSPDEFTSFNQFLQDKINNENDSSWPNDNLLKQWASDYLNQPAIKAKLPDALNRINKDNIFIDTSKIHKDTSPITFEEGAIKTNTNPTITFPAGSIDVSITKATDIQADSVIQQYAPSYLIEQYKKDPNSPLITNTLLSWINSKITQIFNPLPSQATVTSITNITNGSNSNSIQVSVILSKAYTTSEGIAINKEFTFTITEFNAHVKETLFVQNEISYDDQLFKNIFDGNKGFTIDFEKSIIANTNILIQYMNSHPDDFFDKQNEDVVINVTKRSEPVISDNIYTLNINYSGYDDTGAYRTNIQGTFIIHLRPLPNNNDQTSNPFLDFNNELQIWVNNENDGVFPNNKELKSWVVDYLNQEKIISNLPNESIPASGRFDLNDIRIDSELINKENNPILLKAGAISTSNANTSLTLPEASIRVVLTTINNNGGIDVSNSPITSITPEQIVEDQSDANSLTMKNVNNYLNQQKSKIFTNLPNDATIAVAPGTVKIQKNKTLSLKIKVSKAKSLTGIEINKQFDATLYGFGNQVLNDTQLKPNAKEINYNNVNNDNSNNNDEIIDFNKIWTNDKGYAVDWACLTLEQITEKQNQLKDYMNQNINLFFKNVVNEVDEKTQVSKIEFDFKKIKTNLVAISVTYSGNQNNAFIKNKIDFINLKLQSTEGIDSTMDKIIGQNGIIKETIQNWVNEHPGQAPTEEELKTIVNEALDKTIDSADPNSSIKYKDLLPNIYCPSDVIIKPGSITIDGDKVTISEQAIQFKPKQENITTQGNWGSVTNICSPVYEPFIPQSLVVNQPDKSKNNWWIWIIIAGSAAVAIGLIVLIIIFIVKAKKKKSAGVDDFDDSSDDEYDYE